jgi:3-(3-hydroxy-phenyl)propionate hydroxylase
MRPGTPCADAPVSRDGRPAWLLGELPEGFSLLVFGAKPPVPAVASGGVGATVLSVGIDLVDVEGLAAARYDARPGTVYLLRPDQHVAARWRAFDAQAIEAAIARACGR